MTQLNNHALWWWEVIMNNNNKLEFTLPILVTITAAMLVVLCYKFTRSTTKPPLPPGPRSIPIVGYLPFLTPDFGKELTEIAQNYGPIFKLHLGSRLHVVINTTELAKQVVRDYDEIFANRNLTVAASVLTYGGQGLVWSNNNANWRNLRKIFVHEALSNKNLEACRSFRRDEVRKTIKNIFSRINTPINVSDITFVAQANVVTSMICGNASDTRLRSELQMVVWNVVEIMGRLNLSDYFPVIARFDLQHVERDMKKQHDRLDNIIQSMIENRMKSNSEIAHDEKKDFLQILLDLRNQEDVNSLDITDIKALILDIMLAGTDTTTNLIKWVIAELMNNHHVMETTQEELASVVGLNNIVEETHLSKLHYLDAVIKETLRLHPLVPFLIPRSPSQDCIIGGHTIPKDCTVFLNAWSIQRDP